MGISQLAEQVDPVYTDPEFIALLESHMTYFRNHPSVGYITVTEHEADKYIGDFYGLLHNKNIPFSNHLLILRMNGYISSADYDGSHLLFLVPPMDEVELLKETFLSKK